MGTLESENVNVKTPSYTAGYKVGAVLGGIRVDRGSVDAADFTVSDFTTDNTWRDLDLSGIIPVGAKAVDVYILIADSLVGYRIMLKNKAHADASVAFYDSTTTSNVIRGGCGTVSCDSNRIIRYNATSGVWTTINLTIRGWYI